jgi:undecaprenyl-diphosphatase
MDFAQIIVLAIVQGVAEFLPISSSAHLILVPRVFGWTDQGLAIDAAMHLGTLAAVMVYFRRETADIFRGSFQLLVGRHSSDAARLALKIIAATVPVVIVGFLMKDLIGTELRNPLLIAATTTAFGIVLWVADRGQRLRSGRAFEEISPTQAVIIGLAQILALVPGVSRSGITMTAALFLGFKRDAGARFSMLLAIPTTAAAGLLASYELMKAGDAAVQSDALIAACLAFVVALVAIAGLMAWLRQATFTPFVVYRLALGTALATWFAA